MTQLAHTESTCQLGGSLMESSPAAEPTQPADGSRASTALGVAIAAAVVWVVLAVVDHDGPAWLLVLVLGGVAAALGWRAGGGARPAGRALAAVIIGGLAFTAVAVWIIVALISGDM